MKGEVILLNLKFEIFIKLDFYKEVKKFIMSKVSVFIVRWLGLRIMR